MPLASQASRRYAQALLEIVSAKGDEALNQTREELSAFAEAAETVFDLKNILNNPAFTSKEREFALEGVMESMRFSQESRRFLKMIAERDRIGEIAEISAEFIRLSDERAGRVHAIARSASELPQATQEQLKRVLEKRSGKSIELEVIVDPSLIGGIRAQVGSMVFDGTIRAELDKLKASLSHID